MVTATPTEHRTATEIVTFRTDGRWSTEDMVAFLTALNGLYSTMTTLALKERLISQGGYARMLELLGQIFVFEPVAGDISQKFGNRSTVMKMTIASVSMNSPGWFSLEGLGEPVRELRRLIKDLWYANRQASKQGKLEIEAKETENKIKTLELAEKESDLAFKRAKQRLELIKEFTALSEEQQVLMAASVRDNIGVLKRLEDQKLLTAVGESVDQSPPVAGTDQ
jgi:hypothetical protein